ncbi:MAG TPA: uracil-DNA glycosylase [Aromatoleum sp.]|nr:uracil-DNA glycosylase [Aromatoleum sp.]
MGLAPIWRLRGAQAQEAEVQDSAPAEVVSAAPAEAASYAPTAPAARKLAELLPSSDRRPPRPDRPAPEASPHSAPLAHPVAAALDPERARRIAALDWEALEADIRECTACRLCERRKQAVPGVGDRQAEWMLVGEGPGAEEDQRGEPFVGAAGKLLDAMLASIGLKRGEGVYIANAVKCRPPHNRTPQADEIEMCKPYLERQIALIRPRLLLALGRPAAMALLDTELSIGASRGRTFQRGETPVVITYHPAYLLRNQADKAKAWEDLCFARKVVTGR